jgi:hypothetical protein
MPNMVRKLRSLLAMMARKTCPRVSEKLRMTIRRREADFECSLYMNNTTKIRKRFRGKGGGRMRGMAYCPQRDSVWPVGVICITEWNRDAPPCVVQTSGLQR